MKFLDEYRDDRIAKKIVDEIRRTVTRPWVIMEVCGGQTHSIVKYGIDYLLPPEIELVHGPGCPVCVTPLDMIDRAHAIARRQDVIFCSFGDMLRVPGSDGDLFQVRAAGGNVRIVYSPMDCLKIAQANPDKKVVFFAIGFETTAPANAMAVFQAKELGLRNFSLLVSHVVVPPSMTGILQSPGNRVQGFLGPGHVCAIMGWSEYEPIAARYRTPIVITGFEPVDLLEGILLTVRQLEQGRAEVENQYPRAVSREGNVAARRMIAQVFDIADRSWRGIGIIPKSGYKLSYAFREYDADRIFEVEHIRTREPEVCISGQVLKGLKKPVDCPAFATACSPQTPLGATMVSAEGACAAYYNYGRHLVAIEVGGLMVPTASKAFQDAVLRKCRESAEMKDTFFTANAAMLEEVCSRLAAALSSGHQLFVMGNGGSSCDALHVAVEFVHPIIEKRRAFPARALTTDAALLTAIGNDADFSQTFAEQLKVFGKPGDVALGISTSGMSANVNYGLQAARQMGMLTVAFSGKDGGRSKDVAEYCLTVPSFSIHRIQEVHTTLLHVLWDMVHVMLGEEDII